MNIAVFADVHGRVLLAFKLCARWERETGEKLDLILQAGDLGAYPHTDGLDRATIQHARKDPSELGFSQDFITYQDEIAAQLPAAPMIFVRGNHEDHTWLDELERQHTGACFPIDAYQHIFCLKTGMLYKHHNLTILGIGRVGPLIGEPDETQAKYIQHDEKERLYDLDNPRFDILLTHDTALDSIIMGYGMEEIRLILDAYHPPYHFHGHTEEHVIQRLDTNGITQSIKLSDLHFDTSHPEQPLESGSMGILRWQDRDNHAFEIVDANWLSAYTAQHWRSVR